MAHSIILLPLIGFLISCSLSFFKSNKFIDRAAEIITSLFITITAIFSFYIFIDNIGDPSFVSIKLFNWISSGSFNADWSIYLDTATRVMLVVITSVSALVHIYSIGYMSHDDSKPRFMGYLSLFTFAMLMLVTADNFLQLFFGWEGVGLASYLLIGFWYKKPTANAAAIKAFIVNRIGDFGLALGIFTIFIVFGSIEYQTVFNNVTSFKNVNFNFLGIELHALTLICIFLFIGAMGKSAQLFLHTWLPDAMEGPTPVSALIHAATMVTAGVFLVVRCSPLFDLAPVALDFVVLIGASTAFFAATVGLVQNDIKRVIAYSTCSQLGYMFVAAGLGAYGAAMFHLFTHAFFKALLFLGSGSVIHSLNNEQDIRNMGDLWKKMPFTWVAMIVGTLALTGFPLLSGFYSKDAIIEYAYLSQSNIGYIATAVGIITALLTAIYSWRLIFKTFHGKFNNKDISKSKIKESGLSITIPLGILVLGSIFSGFLFKDLLIGENNQEFWGTSILILKNFDHSLIPLWILYITPFLVILAIPLSYYLFLKNQKYLDQLVSRNKKIYEFLLNKWYFDEAYDVIFVRPTQKLGSFFWKSGDQKTIDRYGPDGISKLIKAISYKVSKFQTGYLFDYAFVMLLGFSLLLTFLIIR